MVYSVNPKKLDKQTNVFQNPTYIPYKKVIWILLLIFLSRYCKIMLRLIHPLPTPLPMNFQCLTHIRGRQVEAMFSELFVRTWIHVILFKTSHGILQLLSFDWFTDHSIAAHMPWTTYQTRRREGEYDGSIRTTPPPPPPRALEKYISKK